MVPITEYDFIFISYDEDNAEGNFSILKSMCPWVKRVHGVYGSDNAHKEASKISRTERFVTIDGDTIIDPDFLNVEIKDEIANDHKKVISWCSKNIINGLTYGNGSLKLWSKTFVDNMKTHENSGSPKSRVEFCFEDGYIQKNETYAVTYPNASPKQAFRAGFREGVKMCLDRGSRISNENLFEKIYWKNKLRLQIWCSVGADVKNGLWAMYGARYGCSLLLENEWDYQNVRDFKALDDIWYNTIDPHFESLNGDQMCSTTGFCWNSKMLLAEMNSMGLLLNINNGLETTTLDPEASKFFKSVWRNPKRIDEWEK